MKKLLLLFLMVLGISSTALADDDIYGIITNIDNTNKTITINKNLVIKILPNTKIEIDGRYFDSYGNFASFQLNDFVEVEIMGGYYGPYGNAYGPQAPQTDAPQAPMELIAKSVDIQRKGNRAY